MGFNGDFMEFNGDFIELNRHEWKSMEYIMVILAWNMGI